MLYLINETFYNKERNEVLDILKIGYTSDLSPGIRYATYLNHCPEARLLYEIPGGTLDHESALLNKFRHLLYKGQEWFYYDQEIIDYFETHKTLESLEDLELPEDQNYSEIREYCNKCLSLLLNDRVNESSISLEQAIKTSRSMLDNLLNKRFKNYRQVDEYFRKVFSFNTNKCSNLSDNIIEFLVRFDSLTQFTDKMKLLYDASFEFNEEEMNSILFEINIVFRNYFIVLGRDRIRALQFRKYALDAEYEKIYNNQHKFTDLNKIILSTFLVGKKYTKLFIKDKLSEIYNTLGINLSPKANDIENYFEVSICKVTNKETGKRDHCYEILRKKID